MHAFLIHCNITNSKIKVKVNFALRISRKHMEKWSIVPLNFNLGIVCLFIFLALQPIVVVFSQPSIGL
jgi:hypothetical protein